jgi:nucleotide-binding universal stress UspA family protein
MTEQLIVVPLDGSELSERAIPYAVLHAKTLGGKLLLVTVWEGAEQSLLEALPAVADDLFKEGRQYYEKYLRGVAEKYLPDGVKIDAEVLTGNPADELLKLLDERHADLLAIATHGRSGLSRWWYGSVAGEVLQRATVPRLVVGPKVLAQPAHAIKVDGVLCPLDGSQLSESALSHAIRIAEAFNARLHIVQAVNPTPAPYLVDVPSAASMDVYTTIEEGVKEYLGRMAEQAAANIEVATAILRGPAAEEILEYVETNGIDLIAMSSHGRGGLVRTALGSVADRVIHGEAPIYLIRPTG